MPAGAHHSRPRPRQWRSGGRLHARQTPCERRVRPRSRDPPATVDHTSLTIPSPPEGFLAELLGPQWFNTADFPEIRFEPTAIQLTSPREAEVTGNLTFLGISVPLTFQPRFNGAYPGFPPYYPNAFAGFHASGSLSRAAFGVAYGLPPEGTTMGVGDEEKFWPDAEFTGPPAEAEG